jgi:hypothetical protein
VATAGYFGRTLPGGLTPSRLLLAGNGLDFEHRIHIAVDSRGLQLHTFLARAPEIDIPWKGHMAALLTKESSIQMGRHGPELHPEDAIGTADH